MTSPASTPARASIGARVGATLARYRNVLITFALLFAGWEIAVHVLKAPRYILPAPSAVCIPMTPPEPWMSRPSQPCARASSSACSKRSKGSWWNSPRR